MTEIILKSGESYKPDESFIAQLAELYHRINVSDELKKIAGWNLSNPTRRKTKRGIKKHINTWFTKANDNAHIEKEYWQMTETQKRDEDSRVFKDRLDKFKGGQDG
jgi:hypothetical protein